MRLLDYAVSHWWRYRVAYRAGVIAVVLLISTGQAHEAEYGQVEYFRRCAHFGGCDEAHKNNRGMRG